MPNRLTLIPGAGGPGATTIAIVKGAIGVERVGDLATLFPNVSFEVVDGGLTDLSPPGPDVLVTAVDAAANGDLDRAVLRLRQAPAHMRTIIVLRNADVAGTRRLIQEGAADVLPEPVSEPALALSLERLLTRERRHGGAEPKKGEVVAFLKAGGGVGATTLAVQAAAMLASQAGNSAKICLADLDVQFGAAEFYLDLHNPVTISDCLATGPALAETPFATQLTPHQSGVRILAAPQDLAPLDLISPPLIDALFKGLRRDFTVTLVDLPSVWTAWTNRVLEIADRIVLVTHISVPHTHLVRRQLAVLQSQMHLDKPLILVCNALPQDGQATISIRAAERAIGRPFDVVIPEDSRVVNAAINQGLLIADVKRKTKVEKAINELVGKIAAGARVSHGAVG